MASETLNHRLKKAKIPYNREAFMHARELIEGDGPLDYVKAISYVESIL